jgi:hypothetical protein
MALKRAGGGVASFVKPRLTEQASRAFSLGLAYLTQRNRRQLPYGLRPRRDRALPGSPLVDSLQILVRATKLDLVGLGIQCWANHNAGHSVMM